MTIDPLQFPGIVAQDFVTLFPDALQNTARLISPFGTTNAVIINGPGIAIEKIPGFDGAGRANDNSGLSQELPIMFEIADPGTVAALNGYIASPLPPPINMFIEIRNSAGNITVTWQLNQFKPHGPSPSVAGFDGRTRYTFGPSSAPDQVVHIERSPLFLTNADSLNPAVDRHIIDLFGGRFPRLESVDAAEARFTLVYDFVEAGGMFAWASQTATTGTNGGASLKRNVRIDLPDFSAPPLQYQGCFVVKYEQFTGFGQDIRLKERLIIDCDFLVP